MSQVTKSIDTTNQTPQQINNTTNNSVNNLIADNTGTINNGDNNLNIGSKVIVTSEAGRNTSTINNIETTLVLGTDVPLDENNENTNNRIDSDFLGVKKRLVYPCVGEKGNDKWGILSLAVTNYLKDFTDEEKPEDTMKKLALGVFEVCKEKLKKSKAKYMKPKFGYRDKLIADVDNKKLCPQYTGKHTDLVEHFKKLNTKKETQKPNDLGVALSTTTETENGKNKLNDNKPKKEILDNEDDLTDDENEKSDDELIDDSENNTNTNTNTNNNISSSSIVSTESDPLLENDEEKERKELEDKLKKLKKNIKVKKTFYEMTFGRIPKCKHTKFTVDEFKDLLKSHSNVNTNYDGLSYKLIERCEGLQKKLIELYNKFMITGVIPKYWYYGIAYGLYKGSGDTNEPKSFRTIIRCDTFSKLFWHLLNMRIRMHITKNNIIDSRYQKAYVENVRGIEENLFIHEHVKPKSDFVIYLDIKNAFGSIYPELLEKILKHYGYPKVYRTIICSYINSRIIGVKHPQTKKYEYNKWDCGLSQGLSISNYLFVLCMNYILKRTINKFPTRYGVNLNGQKFLLQAFADDVVIYGNNKHKKKIQKMLTFMNKKLKSFNMELQIKKSYVDYVNKDDKHKFNIDGLELTELPEDNNFKYLGQYVNVDKVWEKFANDVKTSLEKVKTLFSSKLNGVNDKDYWYAYQTMWRHKINWFVRVNDITDDKIKKINEIEKKWLEGIPGLKDKLSNNDFEERKNNALMCRFIGMANASDSRISNLYRNVMGEEQCKKIEKMASTKGVNLNSGFKKNDGVIYGSSTV